MHDEVKQDEVQINYFETKSPPVHFMQEQSETEVVMSPKTKPTTELSKVKPKRKRKSFSCGNCRHSKIKCDRMAPCQQCSLRGLSISCCFHGTGAKGSSRSSSNVSKQQSINNSALLRSSISSNTTTSSTITDSTCRSPSSSPFDNTLPTSSTTTTPVMTPDQFHSNLRALQMFLFDMEQRTATNIKTATSTIIGNSMLSSPANQTIQQSPPPLFTTSSFPSFFPCSASPSSLPPHYYSLSNVQEHHHQTLQLQMKSIENKLDFLISQMGEATQSRSSISSSVNINPSNNINDQKYEVDHLFSTINENLHLNFGSNNWLKPDYSPMNFELDSKLGSSTATSSYYTASQPSSSSSSSIASQICMSTTDPHI